MTSPFVHLHVHTEFSLVDGIVRIKPLCKQVAEMGMPAVAVTDQSNLFSMVKFYRAALSSGVKPIIGVDAWIHSDEESEAPYRLVLLCRNLQGYRNLTYLVTRSYQEGQHRGIPMLMRDWLQGNTDGLIALSGAREGDVGRSILAGNLDEADRLAQGWADLFPDAYYLELQRTGRSGDEDVLHACVELAQKLDLPVVATNDVHFIAGDDFEAHEARVCIHDGRALNDSRRPKNYSEQQYLRSPEEMGELFSDIPEALENTVEIARRCNLELELGKNYLPDFPVPEGMDANSFLQAESRKGLEKRLEIILSPEASGYVESEVEGRKKMYEERLEMELDVIIQMGFPGYFLIVADFIHWAKENDIPVGPGRGSGAGSLVAYSLQITDLDPIHYELLFERFLNPERVSMPDFDIDFCMEQRDRVIEYVGERFGREKVSQIITYGTMAAKAVVRDAGRVLGHPYGFVDRIAKMIPFEIGITLDKALDQEEELNNLYEQEEEVRILIDLARSLEGISRNAGKHAGGVVIAPSKLTDFTPLYCEQGSTSTVTQFDKDDVEAVGLVKFDFLGLRTLTIIDWAVKTINNKRKEANEELLDISMLPMDDALTFDLLKRCATTAVFQLESRGMKDLIKRLKPDCFDEIIALVALFRPGPLQSGMVDDFIDRKHGARVEYPHPDVEPILKPTYGVILYQEQVMQIAQVLAGYTLGGADMLRRAMGKKKPEEMEKQRSIFTEGAVKRGVEEKTATYIFDLMEKFAGYGFNKSHSAAYALISYQTAWLKSHYPSEFMAAVLSSDMDNTDKVVTLIYECRSMDLKIEPPCVNESEYMFTVSEDDAVIYGLGAIKGVGEAAIENIYNERKANGDFSDLFDFCRRIDMRKVNKRVLEALIRSGAMDDLGENRATLMAQLPDAVKAAEQHSHNHAAGIDDLFGSDLPGSERVQEQTDRLKLPPWDDEKSLLEEKEALGMFLSGHPIAHYKDELAGLVTGQIAELLADAASLSDSSTGASTGSGAASGYGYGSQKENQGRDVLVAGFVMSISIINMRRGKKVIIVLEDSSAKTEVTLFSDAYEKYKDFIVKNKSIVVKGKLGPDNYASDGYSIRIGAKEDAMYTIDQAYKQFAKQLVISLDLESGKNGFVYSLEDVLKPYSKGQCPVSIKYRGEIAHGYFPLSKEWYVQPTDDLLNRLRDLAGKEKVELMY